MDYIIISTSKCLYQEWQLRLLKWSADKVKQKGKIIFLSSFDHNHHPENVKFDFPNVEVIELPDWAKEWEIKDGKWWGGIPNKYESINWLCKHKKFKPSDRLLFLDPDMVFLEPIDLYPNHNEIIGQRWINFTALDKNTETIQEDEYGIMYPFAITFYTLKKIIKDYKQICIDIRKKTNLWEAEMWGLHYALEKNNIKFILDDNLGRCTVWNENNSKTLSKILHYPNVIESIDKEKIFFKQDYTNSPTQKIEINKSRNLTDTILLSNIDQERTDYIYEAKWDFPYLFKFYTGNKGYLFFQPWNGGFNNIRMSFEQAICLSYLTDRTLVLPPSYSMYLTEGLTNLSDYFETSNLGIKHISFEELCDIHKIEHDLNKLKSISKIINYDTVDNVVNFEKIPVPLKFLKGRQELRSEDVFDTSKIIFLDKNLLGNFYLSFYTKHETSLKQLLGKYLVYRNDLRDIAWQFINLLGDKSYYSMHVRRNDFQYKDLFIDPEQLLNNIKDIIPPNSNLYIATDLKDKSYFSKLESYGYKLTFYDDLKNIVKFKKVNVNWIPLIEQLICSRGISFIGNDNSTLSTYIYKIRSFMDDIVDKKFYVNTKPITHIHEDYYINDPEARHNWCREYLDVNKFNTNVTFVSIASYRDSQIFDTLKSLYAEVSDPNKVKVVVYVQDEIDVYYKLLELNYPNLELMYVHWEDTKGVVWARNRIKEKFTNESYFLNIDSHSRFKENWDLILINQYHSINEPKVILSTYPNNFDVPDPNKNYLKLPFNTPLKIKDFIHKDDPIDNRCQAENLPSLKDYEIEDTRWVTAGFTFVKGEWLKEVQIPEKMIFSGEEDTATYLSYLKGWNIKVPSEATIWHNYNYKTTEDIPYRTPNSFKKLTENDNSVKELNKILFANDPSYVRSLNDLENYFNIKFKRSSSIPNTNPPTIFISIASFKDYEIRHTILDCINKSSSPENLYFGVCMQYDNSKPNTSESILDDLIKKYNIKLSKFNWTESEGGCWARNICQQFYNGEKYSLQVDAHTRFLQDWDKIIIQEFNELLKNTPNPLISFLPPGYYRDDEKGIDYEFVHLNNPTILNVPTFRHLTDQYWPVYGGYQDERSTNGVNQNVSLLYGGFIFSWGKWIQEVEQDPEHYYTGEEFAIALRSYTSGYDIYLPTKILAWHRIHPETPAKHINTFSNHHEKHNIAVNKLKMLIEQNGDLGKYNLGNKRSLQDYENFAKINFKTREVLL
jgi:hypothetical protein